MQVYRPEGGVEYLKFTCTAAPPPPPSPSPGLPPPEPDAPVFKVTTKFVLSGDINDYDSAAQESIKAVLAVEAAVSTSAVRLSLAAGSVAVTAEIFAASQAAANDKSSALAAGVLSDTVSLQTALVAQFDKDGVPTAALAVEDISEPPSSGGTSMGAMIGGAVGGAFGGVVGVLGCAWLVLNVYKSRRAKVGVANPAYTQ